MTAQLPFSKNHGSVGVVELIGRYYAVYNLEDKCFFITKPGKIDRETAELCAKQFADNYQFTYDTGILAPRIITVLKIGSEWHPVEVHSNGAQILAEHSDDNIKKSKIKTRILAERIAAACGGSFHQSLDYFSNGKKRHHL